MKAVPLVLSSIMSSMLVLMGTLSPSAAQTAPTPDPPPTLPPPFEQKLAQKPKELWRMDAAGVQLYVSNVMRILVVAGPLVDNPYVDAQGLYAKAKQCVAGQGCGVKLTAQAADSIYAALESWRWDELKLDHRLAAVVVVNGYTVVFTDAVGSLTTAVHDVFVRGGVCTPLGGGSAQPQCPPGPIPPRDEWVLNEVLRHIYLP